MAFNDFDFRSDVEAFGPTQDNRPDPAFETELARRVQEIHEGEAQGKPAEQVFAEMERKKRMGTMNGERTW